MSEFLKTVEKMHESNREKAWVHCRKFFLDNKDNSKQGDINETMCLHLACYLASFGMYHNSFLLENDYKIHSKIVKKICSLGDEYWYFDPFKINEEELDERLSQMTGKIKRSLSDIYVEIKRNTKMSGNANCDIISDTLITKVLMGTLGCVPAFDEMLKKGLKACELTQSYTKNNLKNIIVMAKEKNFVADIHEFCEKHPGYTPMRVIDMYLWALGCEKKKSVCSEKEDNTDEKTEA